MVGVEVETLEVGWLAQNPMIEKAGEAYFLPPTCGKLKSMLLKWAEDRHYDGQQDG
jgi:hypothetical protein